ncbi:MAG: restriction endonuclease subunit S [Chlorobiota bacterium]|nr:MAG: restriction endonuclease subunit S [Chlorobiota bacterium]
MLKAFLSFTYLQDMYKGFLKKKLKHEATRLSKRFEKIEIPFPSLEEQQTIVKAIEEEMQLVNANKRLIEIFEQKIKTKIGEVWGVKEEETLSMAAEPQTEYNK